MKQILPCITIGACLLVASIGAALAANPPGTGQPSQTCGVTTGPATPGGSNTTSSPGSVFNPNGVSGGVYAGNGTNNMINSHTVSQYDVACFQVNQIP
jgi:hypothetical protein